MLAQDNCLFLKHKSGSKKCFKKMISPRIWILFLRNYGLNGIGSRFIFIFQNWIRIQKKIRSWWSGSSCFQNIKPFLKSVFRISPELLETYFLELICNIPLLLKELRWRFGSSILSCYIEIKWRRIKSQNSHTIPW